MIARSALTCGLVAALWLAPRSAVSSAERVTTADFAWLVGSWEGRMASGRGVADVTFMKPNAGLMTVVMRLIDGSTVLVVELISIVETPQGLELRFRHFSSALDAYESEFKQAMRLTTHKPGRDVFENIIPFDQKLMSTQPRVTTFLRHGDDEYVGHSDALDQQGKAGIVEVTYRRVRER